MTWLLGWNYRKKITITGTTFGVQTNYPMTMVANKDVGTDTPGNIYLNNHCNDDFSDIIFTSSDGATILGYYLESINPGISANIWVNVDTIPASPGTSDIYIYYGNATAITQSNPDNTFSLHYNGTDTIYTAKWQTLTGNGNYNTVPGYIYMTPSTVVVANNSIPINFELIHGDTSTCYANFPAIHDIKLAKETTQRDISRLYSTTTIGFECEQPVSYTPVLEGITKPNVALYPDGNYTSPPIIVTHVLGIGWSTSMVSSVSQPSLRNPSDILYLHFATPSNHEGYTNYIRVRKYVLPEPTFDGIAIEETILGDVCIKSNPSGASITIDTTLQPGKTTAMSGTICILDNTIVGLSPGVDNHSYEINLAGYQSKSGSFSIISNTLTEIDVGNLTPIPTTGDVNFHVTCESVPCADAYITIDTNIYGPTDVSGTVTVSNLLPGIINFTVSKTDYYDGSESVTVIVGSIVDAPIVDLIPIPPPPTTGDVCIKSNPSGASITIDTTLQPGKTTAMSGTICILDNTIVGLSPGVDNHSYEINLAGYQSKSGNFSIISNTLTEIEAGDLIPITIEAGGGGLTLLSIGLLFGLLLGKKCKDRRTKKECEEAGCIWKDGKCN